LTLFPQNEFTTGRRIVHILEVCVSRRCISEETAKQAEEKEAEAAGAKSSWLGYVDCHIHA
jgi:hypothetical protein